MPIDVTAQYIRARVRMPDEFQAGTMRTVVLSESDGIKSVMGRLKGKDTMSVQSYLFDKAKWTLDKVKGWLAEHNLTVKAELPTEDAGDVLLEIGAADNIGFGYDDLNVKEEAAAGAVEKHLYVEGFATTSDQDRRGDIVDPAFYEHNMKNGYLDKARTLLLNHDPDVIIGHVEKWEIRDRGKGDKGLWVRAQISNAEDVASVRQKIKERALNAFSFRWHGTAGGEEPIDKNVPNGPRRIKAGIILEVSVVSMPANPEAAIEKWFEKALPMPTAEAMAGAGIAASVIEALREAGIVPRVKAPEKGMESKQDSGTKGKGEKEQNMNPETVKKIIEKMTPELWATLDADTQKACKEIDAGIEARLASVKLAAENEALKKQLEKQLADAAKAAVPPAAPAPVAAPVAAPAPAAPAPTTEKALTAADVATIVTDTLKKLAGTTDRRSIGEGETAMLGKTDEDNKLRSMLSGASPEGRELTANEVMEKILGRYFVSDKAARGQLDAMVAQLAKGE